MRLIPSHVPDKIKRLMSPQDRASLGDFSKTAFEIQEDVACKSEKELHDLIKALLNRYGVEWYGHGRMDKASGYTVGWPDFVIPLPNGKVLFWEVKNGLKVITDEQVKCLKWLHEHDHTAVLIQSYQQAISVLTQNLK